MLFVISAPSGTGKTTIRRELEKRAPGIRYSVSCTTRKPRIGEKEGVDYFFIKKEEFESGIKEGRFLEWAKVFGNYYGTDRTYVNELISKGYDVILDIDVQGASQVRAREKNVVTIFVLPPSMDVLKERLLKRNTEPEDIVQKRLGEARKEVTFAPWYDYIVVNDLLDDAVENIISIIRATKCRSENLQRVLSEFLDLSS